MFVNDPQKSGPGMTFHEGQDPRLTRGFREWAVVKRREVRAYTEGLIAVAKAQGKEHLAQMLAERWGL